MLFQPGSTQFFGDQQVTAPYPMWIEQIASRVAQANTCLEIVGHTSATGPAQLNERLSVLRAQSIKIDPGAERSSGWSESCIATGVGPRETLIGTGKDDASDALDRRVR